MRYLVKVLRIGFLVGFVLSVIFISIEFFANENLNFDFEIGEKEKKIIKVETKKSLIIAYCLMISVFIHLLLAYFLTINMSMNKTSLNLLFNIFNIMAIFIIILVLGLKKSLYFSPRIIKEDFDLAQILQKWQSLDIVFLSLGSSISVTGLVVTFLGMPFNRTFHFFIVSGLVILMVMPMSWSVEGKLRALKNNLNRV